nr:PREDICTED: mRNA-decapping enzyme 1A isoform X1 [Latimeria chalumnae]|eukprot:XP_014342134.1 PREDICTED: mRNA-decapping enzyme 1A isoform X1 [Latimeria chalumnae]
MEAMSKAGRDMSLAALKRHDPYISSIIDVTGQVALYTFNSKANEWVSEESGWHLLHLKVCEKTDIEGTLFVYTRSASPYYVFTIMNRLSMHNLVEPVNKDLEFQPQEPFLLYRNSSLSIYSIWFYNKNDCLRIAQLMKKVVQLETQRVQQGSPGRNSPNKTNDCGEDRSTDILEMLSKAKEEYERNHLGDSSIVPSPSVQPNTVSVDVFVMEVSDNVQQDKHIHSGPKHLTVEELFGTSLSKEQPLLTYPNQEIKDKPQHEALLRRQSLVQLNLSEQTAVTKQSGRQPANPDDISNAHSLNQQGISVTHAPVLQPDINSVPSYIRSSPVFNLIPGSETTSASVLPSLNKNDIQTVPQAVKCLSPLMNHPPSEQNQIPQNLISRSSPYLSPRAVTSTGSTSSVSFPNPDLLHRLKLIPQHEQVQPQTPSKPTIAPNFLPPVNLVTPESFKESYTKPVLNTMTVAPLQTSQQNKEPDVFPYVKSSSKTQTVVTAPSSVLLSPSVFQQSTIKSTESENQGSSVSPLTLGVAEGQPTAPSTVLSRSQLQETLIHLIQNDPNFVNIIHEAYLQITKNLGSIKL